MLTIALPVGLTLGMAFGSAAARFITGHNRDSRGGSCGVAVSFSTMVWSVPVASQRFRQSLSNTVGSGQVVVRAANDISAAAMDQQRSSVLAAIEWSERSGGPGPNTFVTRSPCVAASRTACACVAAPSCAEGDAAGPCAAISRSCGLESGLCTRGCRRSCRMAGEHRMRRHGGDSHDAPNRRGPPERVDGSRPHASSSGRCVCSAKTLERSVEPAIGISKRSIAAPGCRSQVSICLPAICSSQSDCDVRAGCLLKPMTSGAPS